MQAIVTKYLGPTNKTGSRVMAKCSGGTKILTWDDALNHDGNMAAAAKALWEKMGWGAGTLVGGGLPEKMPGGWSDVFVNADGDAHKVVGG